MNSNTVDTGAQAKPLKQLLPLALVLVIEYLIVSLRFDALTLAERGYPWTLMSRVGTIAPVGIAVAAALILYRVPKTWAGTLRPARLHLALLHAVIYAGFIATTWLVFGATAPLGSAYLWLGAWLSMALLSGLSLLAVVFSPKLLWKAGVSSAAAAALALGVSAWLAGILTVELWAPLSNITFIAVASVLEQSFTQVTVDPAEMLLGLDDFYVTIAPECSGYEGIGLIGVLVGGYLYFFRASLKFPRALLLWPLAIISVWVGNVLRICALMVVGARIDPELAYEAFHSKAGWVMFCAIGLGITALGQRARWFSKTADTADAEFENPTATYLLPLLVLVGGKLVTGLFKHDVDLAYALPIALAVAVLYVQRQDYAKLKWSFSPLAAAAGLVVGLAWVFTEPAAPTASALAREAFAPYSQIFFLGWLAARIFGSVVVVPICEELAFRGFLLRWLIAREFDAVSFKAWTPLALGVSSLVFGLMHGRILAATLAGLVYALLQLRRGVLADAIVAHMVTNAVVAFAVVFGDAWTHWI